MSNLLKEAIVDAKALKDVALKNAEAAIIEKYSIEVKEAFDRLIDEQGELGDLGAAGADPLAGLANTADELGAEPLAEPPADVEEVDPADSEQLVDDEDAPLAAADNLSGKSREGAPKEFQLDLGVLQEAIEELQGQLEESEEFEISESDLVGILSEDDDEPEADEPEADEPEAEEKEESEGSESLAAQAPPEDEVTSADFKNLKKGETYRESVDDDLDLDSLVDAITEKLTVDMGADLSGWAGRSSYDMKYELERDLAHRRSTEVQEELEVMKKAQEELVFENKQLQEQLSQYKQATNELKESLQDVNLSNARLLYTNRVLRNTSLNERQKERIVEAISNAGSVTEARTIFDTLQSTAQATPKKSPQSLSEAITRRSSVIRASRAEKHSSDPFQDRMKKLAGIK
jgi:hypothetical protein